MESTNSSTLSPQPQLPPGFRFHPTDEELVIHYLKKKITSTPLPVAIIADVDIYKFDPWELPAKASFGEQEWYFFSPRDRKYPNGARPNRAATSGYWKATGIDKPIVTAGGTEKVGVKKSLVFYGGKPPKGIKTNWIMHEYRLIENVKPKHHRCGIVNKKASLRLDDWVLCRIYTKNNTNTSIEHLHCGDNIVKDIYGSMPLPMILGSSSQQKLMASNYGIFPENDHNMLDGMVNRDNIAMNGGVGSNKRLLPTLYCNEEMISSFSSPTTKGFHAGNSDEIGSIATILSQLPQASSMNQQAMLNSIGIMNLYS